MNIRSIIGNHYALAIVYNSRLSCDKNNAKALCISIWYIRNTKAYASFIKTIVSATQTMAFKTDAITAFVCETASLVCETASFVCATASLPDAMTVYEQEIRYSA